MPRVQVCRRTRCDVVFNSGNYIKNLYCEGVGESVLYFLLVGDYLVRRSHSFSIILSCVLWHNVSIF